jgi:CTP:molybdopterin cytidylyltransferase MocA
MGDATCGQPIGAVDAYRFCVWLHVDSPLVSMEGVARLIAGEIIGANRVREQ